MLLIYFHLEMDNGGRLKTNVTFPLINFPFISSNNSAVPVYGVYI